MRNYVPREKLFLPTAVSIRGAAASLDVRVEKIRTAIKQKKLKCYRHGTQRRILLVDLTMMVRKHWSPK